MSVPVKIDPAMWALMKGAFGAGGMPMPFTREIFLIDTHIAGTTHRDLDDIEPLLEIGELLCFKRDPDNKYDKLAIRIYDERGNWLGFVPKKNNAILARLMDAGKLIIGRLEDKSRENNWLKLAIRIYMREI